MPYLRLSSVPLDVATKRHLAERLTAAVLERMPAARPEWTAVHFTPYRADEFAAAGLLVSDGAPAAAHLEVEAHDVDERTWRRLRRDLSNVLTGVLQRGADTVPITLKLNRYDAHTFAAGGRAVDERPRREQHRDRAKAPDPMTRPEAAPGGEAMADARDTTEPPTPREAYRDDALPARGERRGWLRPAVVLGFAIGAVVGFRWIGARVRSDASVDAAPPVADLHGEAVDAGEPDPRSTAAPAAPSETGS